MPSYGSPAGSRWFVTELPLVSCDLVLVTHPHFDHDAVHRVRGCPSVVRDPVRIESKDLVIEGYKGLHAGPYGLEFRKRNVVFTIEAGGLTLCHLGDNQANLPSGLLDRDNSIDVLIVPVDDDCHLLSFADIERMIETVNPRVVIPVHYHIEGITHGSSPLAPIGKWLDGQARPVRPLPACVELKADVLPTTPEVWTMRPTT